MVSSYISSDFNAHRKLYIVDARPRANALANGAKGGGSESASNYPRSEVYSVYINFFYIPYNFFTIIFFSVYLDPGPGSLFRNTKYPHNER